MPLGAVLPADHRFGLGAECKMLVLDDPGIGRFRIGIVHHRVALIVVGIQHLSLKADAAVLQRAQTVAEVGIHRAGINDLVGQCVQALPVGQIIHVQPHLDALQHLFHHGGIAAIGDALIQRVEIVVVVGKADRQAFDDESRQFGAGAAPLLAGVAFDELFVDVRAHQTDGLLLKIFRVGDARFPLLLLDLCLGLGGGHHTPHLIEGVHIEGQIVDLAVIVGNGAVGVAVELRKLVHILPHCLAAGVENVGPIAVDLNALHFLGVDIPGNVAALINHKACFARLFCFLGEHRTVKACAYDEIIVMVHPCFSFFLDSGSFLESGFFWLSRYWSMAVWMRARAASGVICLSWAAAIVWWPPPPRLSMMT